MQRYDTFDGSTQQTMIGLFSVERKITQQKQGKRDRELLPKILILHTTS